MRPVFASLAFGVGLLASSHVLADPPGPALPPKFMPAAAKIDMLVTYESDMSQALGMRVIVHSMRIYFEQDGSMTTCTVGTAGGRPFRIASRGSEEIKVQPSKAEWVDMGCTRPNYTFIG